MFDLVASTRIAKPFILTQIRGIRVAWIDAIFSIAYFEAAGVSILVNFHL